MSEDFEVACEPKPITGVRLGEKRSKQVLHQPQPLIFTHGAGGDIRAGSTWNFCCGFAAQHPVLGFNGNSNLASRTKMFSAVVEAENTSTTLGGSSMGARAAVLSVTPTTENLILVSYPLQGPKDVRDQILVDLAANLNVLFVTGDSDSMCDINKLRKVMQRMKPKTWLITVKGANHGISVKPATASEAVQRKTGEIAAEWLSDRKEGARDGMISWDKADDAVHWSGWAPSASSAQVEASKVAPMPKTSTKRKAKALVNEQDLAGAVTQHENSKDKRAERAKRRSSNRTTA